MGSHEPNESVTSFALLSYFYGMRRNEEINYGNKGHQEAYRNNIPIKSKSKELYRQKLYQKRDIFERNGLDHYILLPDEMNEETYKNILNKYLKEVA